MTAGCRSPRSWSRRSRSPTRRCSTPPACTSRGRCARSSRCTRRRRLGRARRDVRRRAAPGAAAARRRAALDGLDLVRPGRPAAGAVADAVGAVDAPDRHGLTGPSSPEKTLLRVFSPFEVACLDLQGQAIGRPVYDLLGGRVRDRVPFSAYLFYKWAGASRRRARRLGRGARPGRHRRAGPADDRPVRLRLDQAQGRGVPAGRGDRRDPGAARGVPRPPAAARPERAPGPWRPRCGWPRRPPGLLEYLEDPTPGIAGHGRGGGARRRCRWPPTCAWSSSPTSPRRSRRGAVGVVLSDHHYWGGLRASARLAGDLRDLGRRAVHALQQPPRASAWPRWRTWRRPPRTSPTPPTPTRRGSGRRRGRPSRCPSWTARWPCPTAPGLGVTLDRDALARMHEDYLRCGIRERDDTGVHAQHPARRTRSGGRDGER